MAEYESEELDSLKRWWAKNGTSLIVGVLVGALIIGAWQGWRWYTNHRAAAAADTYAQVRHGIAAGKVNPALLAVVARLKKDYAATPYAGAATLRLAAYYVGEKKYAKAIAQLDWAMHNASSEGVAQIARVRKARLVWTQGKPDAALALLDSPHPDSFESLYAELAGDIHADQGERAQAYKAYKRALASLPPDTPQRPIETKMSQYAPKGDSGAESKPKASSAS